MRKLILPLMFAVPTLAMAASVREYELEDHKPKGSIDGDKLHIQPGAVTLAGTAELPLVDCGMVHCIEVTMGEETLVMELVIGTGVKFGDAQFPEAKEKTVKKHGAAVKTDTLSFNAGDAQFEVLASNGYPGVNDGSLGLLSFPELAVAIVPSEGVVRFSPAGTGVTVDGETLAYTLVGSRVIKDGGKRWIAPEGMVVDGMMGEDAVRVRLSSSPSLVASDAVPDDAVLRGDGVKEARFDLALGGQTLGMDAALNYSKAFTKQSWDVSVGANQMVGWDIGWDPAAGQVTFNEASTITRVILDEDPIETALEALTPPVSDEPGADTTLEGAALAGAHTGVASAYSSVGDLEKALEHAVLAQDADPGSCTTHLAVGNYLLLADRYEDAIPHFEESGTLYKAWGDLPLAVRTEHEEQKAELEEDGWDYEGPAMQSSSCHGAWGMAATAKLALGDYDGTVAYYDDHMDLDANLARAAGLARMAQGRYDEAEAAWRQYLRLAGPSDPTGQQALGVLNVRKGQADLALGNFAKSGLVYTDILSVVAWANTLAELEGMEAANAALDEHIAADADNPHLLLSKALFQAEHEVDNAETLAAASALYEQRLSVLANKRGDLWGGLALSLALSGDADGARTAATEALAQPDGAALRDHEWLAYEAQSVIAAGDEALALKEKAKLASGSPIKYAL
jgi:hypothetical protein